MKKSLVFLVSLMIIFLTSLVSASIHVQNLIVDEQDDYMHGVVKVKNTADYDMDNVKVSIIFLEDPDFYVYDMGQINSYEKSSTIVHTYSGDLHGEHLVRVNIYDEDGNRRVKHRYIYFD